jgi:hypothetical protein
MEVAVSLVGMVIVEIADMCFSNIRKRSRKRDGRQTVVTPVIIDPVIQVGFDR